MRVSDRMTPNPTSIRPDDTLAAAKALMNAEGFRHLPVVGDSGLVGILTPEDVYRHGARLSHTRVDAAMKPNPIIVRPETSVEDAARILLSHKIRGLPVVEKDQLVGMITTTDLLKALLDMGRRRRLP
ncbi:MAG: CBS domain-containing protein [Candidatus Binataceae bacterium]